MTVSEMDQMQRCRIYTEWKQVKKVLDLASEAFHGFTNYKAKGVWKKKQESSLIIEVVIDESQIPKLVALAERIKHALNQESVFVTTEPCHGALV